MYGKNAPHNKTVYSTGYIPRQWQRETHSELTRHNVLVFHRRGGKSVFGVNEILDQAWRFDKKDRLTGLPLANPQYAFIATTVGQVEKIAWNYFKHYLKDIPYVEFNEAKLRITFPHRHGKCTIFLLGGENYDSIRGIYLDGYVLDEFADMHPDVRDKVLLPTLSDRLGWELIIGTPKGDNAFKRIYDFGRGHPGWFTKLMTVQDTDLIEKTEQEDLKASMTEEAWLQEYMCDFNAAPSNKYYQKYMMELKEKKQIAEVPHESNARVMTFWDLGFSDSCAIWFIQEVGREIRVINYMENHGLGLDHYVPEILKLSTSHGYVYGNHYIPHDGGSAEISTGRTRKEFMENMGLGSIIVLPKPKTVADGIHAVRTLLPRCFFDANNCKMGVEALMSYERKYDPKLKVYSEHPLHNWASHGADAFRIFGEAYEPGMGGNIPEAILNMKDESDHSYDPFKF